MNSVWVALAIVWLGVFLPVFLIIGFFYWWVEVKR